MITTQAYKIGNNIELMGELPDDSVDLVVTSPPYYNEKEYSNWSSYKEYLHDASQWLDNIMRIMKPGHRICWNVGDIFSKSGDIIPLSADYHHLFKQCGFSLDSTIIWNKTVKGGKTNWGSWLLPSNPCIQTFHEFILIYKKPGKYILPDSDIKKLSKIPKDLFLKYRESVWSFAQVTPNNTGHPAPFPDELPKRCIQFYSFVGDLVLDPFVGKGTTLKMCRELNRNGLGFELNPEYEYLIKKNSKIGTLHLEAWASEQVEA